ncbi:response regulator [Pricia sp. S334]|uniref:Response regulator n=1 Tax=Pricia mediterranea TaxID=3076079 RepID=A0ABU3L3M2_9FLAO|nr:response regulator [Pricia sp. S334]MDT7827983.1 response regulator [Pricia sp. S334]
MYDAIYLVDDFEIVNILHRLLLRKLGLEGRAREFTDPELALEDLRHALYGDQRLLILLDINMPGLNGFEFLEHMVKEGFPPSIDVVVVTSSVSEGDMEMAKKFPQFVRDFVVKPLGLGKLEEILKRSFGP